VCVCVCTYVYVYWSLNSVFWGSVQTVAVQMRVIEWYLGNSNSNKTETKDDNHITMLQPPPSACISESSVNSNSDEPDTKHTNDATMLRTPPQASTLEHLVNFNSNETDTEDTKDNTGLRATASARYPINQSRPTFSECAFKRKWYQRNYR